MSEPLFPGERWCWRSFGNGPGLYTLTGGAKAVLIPGRLGDGLATRDAQGRLVPVRADFPRARMIEAAPIMADALLAAANAFRHYAALHGAKSPPDTEKAARNAALAETCELALRQAGVAVEPLTQETQP